MACAEFVCAEFRGDAGRTNGAAFLRGVAEAFPHAAHTVLADNGIAFADLPKNRTVKEATIKASHYPDLESLEAHVLAFVSAHNFATHLKAHPMANPLRSRLPRLDRDTRNPRDQPVPPHPGTKQAQPCRAVLQQAEAVLGLR